ncbi:helix-turn-helix domain-containing protein [Paraburkholderia phytofirmans]|uniref:Transcriptional regulator, AraC family n=1 Tax=Paraburkholderia phytofirmans (strain DSM 17436 / LMG 22146 / PsJN) TaxID=398527 RepID=B2T964_PARPJ|nr:helix-turn-helix domain-containing protein [Paraburkholderia phytofirmans]ACD20966.1 transcriptional regulator, AraC family [Paraburkholderia phytofirmans PsJN]
MPFQSSFLRHTYSGFEPSQAFDIVYGGSFEHRLLSSKRANMTHQRLTLDEIRLETGCYDFPVIAQGSMPPNSMCIGFMADGSDVTRYNTVAIGQEDIQIYPAGVELLYHAVGASRWVNFTVPEERLQETALARTGRLLELPGFAATSVRLRPGGRAALTCLADDAMGIAKSLEPTGGMAPEFATEVSRSLVAGYVDELANATPGGQSESSSGERRHHHLILACERLVVSGEEADIALAEIARRSGYSLRSLELIFRRSVGMTPGRWFMNVRLNGALRDLLGAGPTCTVADVASRWGFRHMSRFSEQYRKAFGELPSRTLSRSRT